MTANQALDWFYSQRGGLLYIRDKEPLVRRVYEAYFDYVHAPSRESAVTFSSACEGYIAARGNHETLT